MARIGDQKLQLIDPKDQYGSGFDDSLCDHDPHLQEEKLRWLAGLDGTQAITVTPKPPESQDAPENGDGTQNEKRKPRCVYGIVHLSSPKVEITGLKILKPLEKDAETGTRSAGGGTGNAEAGGDAAREAGLWGDQTSSNADAEDVIAPCVIDLAYLEKILAREEVLSLRAADDVHLHLYNSVPAVQCDPMSLGGAARENGTAYPGLDGTDVVIGIVDVGCDFRHANFRKPSGATRIRYFWDQSEEAKPALVGPIKPPEPYGHGREFTSELIDQALAAGDENAYEALGYTPPIAVHGTHVMDIAAGNGREPALFNGKSGPLPPGLSAPGVAPDAQIIFVQLQSFDGRGFIGNSCHLLEAVQYIFERADELGLPAVVNLSLSSTGGPHDGTTLIERAFEALVRAKRGRAIVTSAGNSFALRSHLSGEVGKPIPIDWYPDPRFRRFDQIKSEMEIWYPGTAELTVSLYAPSAAGTYVLLGDIPLGETKELYGETRLGRISHRKKDRNNGDNQIDVRLPYLEDFADPQPWRIEIASKDQRTLVPFHAWIEQSERGLAYFAGETDQKFTLGSICCGQGTLTVGAFDTFEMASLAPPYEVTSSGPIRPTAGIKPQVAATDAQSSPAKPARPLRTSKPELCAPGVNIVAARSQGGVTSLSGTSMAAPHVSGLIALLFQLANLSGRGPLSWDETRMILTYGLKLLPRKDFKDPPDPRLGYGRINGPAAIAELLTGLPRSIIIDLKLNSSPNGRNQIADFPALFNFLHGNAKATCPGATKESQILVRLNELIQKNDWFRLKIESLG